MRKFLQLLSAVVALAVAVPVFAQTYADEATDWGVKPTSRLETNHYHSKTPTTVPGAKTVTTVELKKLLDGPNPPLLFDVLKGSSFVIQGAIYLGFDAGDGRVYVAEKARFAKMLQAVTNGDKNRQMVFYCLSSLCWLSYNATLRAVGEDYRNVMWYRGGAEAWKTAGFQFVGALPYAW
ncbi:MAG: rhodanese-like domain-containing protein [Candidatus Parcubacteria bacterium]|nr:rhodanese-like domain-containing protein [Candidatus Parcubacteria bacterium]